MTEHGMPPGFLECFLVLLKSCSKGQTSVTNFCQGFI